MIGIGGLRPWPKFKGIARRVNWVGIGPTRKNVAGNPHPVVTFRQFRYEGADGPLLEKLAPLLAHRIYSKNVRVLMDGLSASERKEVDKILARAKRARPSERWRASAKSAKGC